MRRKATCLSFVCAVAVLAVAPVYAGIIYDNGGPNQANGNEMTAWIQAEDFVLGADLSLTDIHFWSLEASEAYHGSITYTIYQDAAGEPGAIVTRANVVPTTRAFTGNTAFSLDEYEYRLDITPLALGGGVTYWLGLHNGLLSSTGGAEFYWETTGLNATLRGREDSTPFDDSSWSNNSAEHAFNLTDDAATIPEPGTLALLGAGLTALAARRRKQRP